MNSPHIPGAMMDDEERRAKNAEKQRNWRAKNGDRAREKARENAKRWREANPERQKILARESYERRKARDPEGMRAAGRESMANWRAANPEKAREADRRWREQNPEASREKSRRWRENNQEKVAEANAAYSEQRKERRQHDPGWAQEQRDRSAQWSKDNPEKVMEKYKQRREDAKAVLRDKVTQARYRASKLGLAFDDALYDIVGDCPAHCESCGVKFDSSIIVRGQPRRALSIDRIDNTNGYTVDNVGFICFRCNELKADATADELEAILAYIRRGPAVRS